MVTLSPISVAVDGTGNVYVVDDGRDDIQKFDADGTFLPQIQRPRHGRGAVVLQRLLDRR